MFYFGDVAKRAVELVLEGNGPAKAWELAVGEIKFKSGEQYASRTKRKTCPKNTFLALIKEGKIAGVQADKNLKLHAKSEITSIRALDAISIISKRPGYYSLEKRGELWNEVCVCSGKVAHHQGQMDVIIGLLNSNLLVLSNNNT